jgi:hypothetical protein
MLSLGSQIRASASAVHELAPGAVGSNQAFESLYLEVDSY